VVTSPALRDDVQEPPVGRDAKMHLDMFGRVSVLGTMC
jgi:hypothetical protein